MDKFKNYPIEIPVFSDIQKKHGEKICGAPWTSLIFEANGEIRFCCMAQASTKGDIKGSATNLDDVINSPKAMEIRKHFLDGTMARRAVGDLSTTVSDTESYCDVCWDLEQRYNHPADPREAVTEWSQHTIDELIANTDANGYMHKIMPTWFDIVFSNKCNFSCMGCNLDNSTTIGKYLAAFQFREGHESVDVESITEEEAYKSNVDADALIDYIIEHRETITHVHFQGGEPFMMPEVYRALDRFIEHDLHKEDGIYIWCHTNGSIRSFKGEDIIEKYLSKWEGRFQISISHDGFGPRGEYIRYGYKDKKWLETFHRIHDTGARLSIQHSINIFNILHQEDCLHWYWDNCLSKVSEPHEIGFTINPWGGLFKFENIIRVPDLAEKAVRVLENSRDFCQNKTIVRLGGNATRIFDAGKEYDQYINAVSASNANSSLPEDVFASSTFIRAVNKFDEMRGTNFHKTFPELKKFWDFCNV